MKIAEFNDAMSYLTRPAEVEREGYELGGVTRVTQGKNKGKFAKKISSRQEGGTLIYGDTLEDLEKKYKEYQERVAERKAKAARENWEKGYSKVKQSKAALETKEYPKNFVTRTKFKELLDNNELIKAPINLANFAEKYKIKTKPNPYNKSEKIYDISFLDDSNKINKIAKRQSITGQGTSKAAELFSGQTTTLEAQKKKAAKRNKAVREAGGNIKFGSGSKGVDKSHIDNIYSEFITGQNVGYAPDKINQNYLQKLDVKLQSLDKKRQKLLEQNPSDLSDQLEDINVKAARIVGQSQGYKSFAMMDPKTKEKFTFGGGRFQFDPVDLFPGKTEQEIVDLKKTYFIGDKLKKDFFSDGKFTGTAEDFENIKNLTIFDQNRKATLENVQQNKKKLTEDFISKKSLDDLVLDNMKNVASGKGSQAGFMRADVPLELVKGAGRLGLRALGPLGTVAGTVGIEGALAAGRPIEETVKDPLTGLALVLPEAGKNVVRNARLANMLNLGMKASTLARMTPIGLGITGLQLGYGLYEKGQEQKAMMDAMTPYQRELYESQLEGEAFEGEAAGFKKGGRVDKKSKKDLPGQPDPTLPIDPSRRDFLEKTGGGIAGLAALGMGAFKISKVAPKVKETIMNFPSDAPNWLLPLYNKIKSLGTESSVKATDKTPGYTVTDLKTEDGNYKITENQGTGEIVISADTDAGINYSPVDFIITPNKVDMVESRAVGRMTGPDDYDIDLEEYVTNDLDDLGSDWHALEEFATGKTNKEAQVKKQTTKSYIEENPGEDISSRQGEMPDYDPEDYYD